MKKKLVSVIVLTRDRAESLRSTLLALQAQEYPSYEIVVIDNCSVDYTPEVAAEFNVRYIRYPGAGVSICRQHGIEVAQGEFVAMCDDDCRPAPDWLSHLVRRLCSDENLGMVGGRSINVGFSEPYKGRGKTGRNGVISFVADPYEAEYYSSQNIIFRRAAAQQIGGYDPFFRTGGYEEIDIMTRLRRGGFRIAYEPNAVVEHHHVDTDHRSGRLFYSGPAPRLYFYLKLHRPETLSYWIRFLGYEVWLLAKDLQKLIRPVGVSVVRLEFERWPKLGVRLFNYVSARLAIPWLLWRGRSRRLFERKNMAQMETKTQVVE